MANPPDPQMFIPRKPGEQEELEPVDHRINLLHIQERYNVHTHGSTGGGLRFATKVVAASNSVDATATDYDYLCTGTADDTTINTAISAAGIGGRVLLLEGTYNLAGEIDLLYDSQVLEGQGWGTILKLVSGAPTAVVNGSPTSGRNGQVVANLKIDGGTGPIGIRFGQNNTNVRVDNVWCTNVSDGVMYLSGLGGSAFGIISRCRVDVFTNTGVFVVTGAPDRTTVRDCDIDMSSVTTGGQEGISIGGGIAIANHIFSSNHKGTGIESSGDYDRIIGNTIETAQGGIYLNQTRGTKVIGNTILDVTDGYAFYFGGAWAREAIVANNFCRTGTQHAMWCQSLRDSIIEGNVFENFGTTTNNAYDGIYFHNTSVDNMFRGNTFRAGANQLKYIVETDASSVNNVVVHNDAKGAWATAFILDGSGATLLNLDGSANVWNKVA